MNPTVAYMDHPIGETNGYAEIQRADNLANAVAWVKFLADVTQWIVHCPWYLNAVAIGDDSYNTRRMECQLALIERSDIYVAVGGYISPHMTEGMRRARRCGVPIMDLTLRCVTPPEIGDELAHTIVRQASMTVASKPRRVWMPLLTHVDLAALHAARHSLYIDTVQKHDSAVDVLDRIISAAATVIG